MKAESQNRYPIHFKGNPIIFERLNLKIQTTINTPKPYPMSICVTPKKQDQGQSEMQTLVRLQVLDENMCEGVIRGRIVLKQDIFYIYYPSQFRVDQKIYRKYCRNFENLLDEAPKIVKMNIHKLLIWQEGKGEHSVGAQIDKLNEAFSFFSKLVIDSKIASVHSDIKQSQSQKPTPKSLLHSFLLKNKLVTLFQLLHLHNCQTDILIDIWQQIMLNFRCLMKLAPSKGAVIPQKLTAPQDIPRAPYIFTQINDIIGYFESSQSTAYLRIVTYAFLKLFDFYLETLQTFEGVAKLKNLLDFILSNVLVLGHKNEWSQTQHLSYDVARNIWALQIISHCMKKLKKLKQQKKILIPGNDDEHKKIFVTVCSMQRNAVERIGLLIYKFDNFSIFPKTVRQEILLVAKIIRKDLETKEVGEELVYDEQQQKQREQALMQKIPQVSAHNNLKLKDLISEKMLACEFVRKVLTSLQGFGDVYSEVLEDMYQALKISPYPRVSRSLSVTFHKATIMLANNSFKKNLFVTRSFFAQKWDKLAIVDHLYYLYLLVSFHPQSNFTQFMIQTLFNQSLAYYHQEWIQLLFQINRALKGRLNDYLWQKQSVDRQCVLFGKNKRNIKCWVKCKSLKTLFPKSTKVYLQGCSTQIYCDLSIQADKANVRQDGQYWLLTTQISLPPNRQEELIIMAVDHLCVQMPIGHGQTITMKYGIKQSVLQINTPLMEIQQQETYIYEQIWTPFTFRLCGFANHTMLKKILIQQVANSDNGVQISQNMYIQRATNKNENNERNRKNSEQMHANYVKLGNQLNIAQMKQGCVLNISIFLKANPATPLTTYSICVSALLTTIQQQKPYKLSRTITNIAIKPLFKVSYHHLQRNQQFSLSNLSKEVELFINQKWSLQSAEQICLSIRKIKCSPIQFKAMLCEIDLTKYVPSQHLMDINQLQSNYIKISYVPKQVFKCFQKIQVICQRIGKLEIKGYNEEQENGYELIGKIGGRLSHLKNGNQNQIDLWVIPVRTGNLILPQIWIEGKKTVWSESMIMGIQ